MKKRVVITGIGAVTPLGNDIGSTWTNLTKGISGIAGITRFDPAGLSSRIAGELKGFGPEEYMGPKDILRLDPFVHYAAAAAIMAVKDAKLGDSKPACRQAGSKLFDSAGVVIGSSRGGITSIESSIERNLIEGRDHSAYLMSSSTINMAASYISMRLGIKGPTVGVATACASGTTAIGTGFRMIQHGEADLVLAGGSDAPICRFALGGYGASGALSTRYDQPERASRPFDLDRNGFVIAEGAAVLVLEEFEHAIKRGATIYAEIGGYGSSSDAFHQTQPDSEGEALSIKGVLDDAGAKIDEIDYINAHATSTPLGDAVESEAIRKVFGKYTDKIDVSSSKSMLGHMLGAAGAIEAAITALSLHKGVLTPTINLDNTDSSCDLNHLKGTISKDIRSAISNSFGFGGVNAVLLFKKR